MNNNLNSQLNEHLLSDYTGLFIPDVEQSPFSGSSISSNALDYCPSDLSGDDLLRIIQNSPFSDSDTPLLDSPDIDFKPSPANNVNILGSPANVPDVDFQSSPLSINDINEAQVLPVTESNVASPLNLPIKIEYRVFPDVIPKHQRRMKGKSEQRIKNGNISFILDFQDVITSQLIYGIQVYVKRTNEVAGTPQFIGPVNLEPRIEVVDAVRYLVHIDLDSVYEVNGKKVYELQKTLTNELNTYHLIVAVTLKDGRSTNLQTKEFLLLGKETHTAPKPPAEKRPRKPSITQDEFFYNMSNHSSPSSGYSSGEQGGYSSGGDQGESIIRARRIVADHVKTKSMEIDGVLISNKIVSPNGDIAYHFTLEDASDFFEEGEVVGLYTNKNENKQKLVKLTNKNASQAMLKGVITRSQYFEAMKPPPGVKSETICMMGIVPVKVHGKVYPNDPLYASPRVPGVAVSGLYLNEEEIKGASLIGYSFQSRLPQDEDKIGMVQAGVSVLSSASQALLSQRLQCIEHEWEQRLLKVMGKNKKFRRGLQVISLTSVVFVVFLGILLWQLLLPGSALRYYQCRIGSLSGKTSSFILKKGEPIFDNFDVNGIEFRFKTLMDKINSNAYMKMKENGTRYYLNVDRCAYGGERSTKDHLGAKRVSGTLVFAVDKKCTKVYKFYEFEQEWKSIARNEIGVAKLKCYP